MNVNFKNFKINIEIKIIIFISIISLFLINFYNLDFFFADLIYLPTHSWLYQEHWLTTLVIHNLGKYIIILMYLVLLYKFFFDNKFKLKQDSFARYGFMVLLLSTLLGTLLVSTLKHLLEVDCPWDLLQYGGNKPYFSLFNYDTNSLPSTHCFPAGHASTAFTWVSLYFYASIYYPKYRLKILTIVLLVGFIFGLSQQFRGAHFISHDITSLLVCVFTNIVVYKIAFNFLPQPFLKNMLTKQSRRAPV